MCPFVLRAKLIFQDDCKSGKEWDDPLSPEEPSAVEQVVEGALAIGSVQSRTLLGACITSVTLLCQLTGMFPISVQ